MEKGADIKSQTPFRSPRKHVQQTSTFQEQRGALHIPARHCCYYIKSIPIQKWLTRVDCRLVCAVDGSYAFYCIDFGQQENQSIFLGERKHERAKQIAEDIARHAPKLSHVYFCLDEKDDIAQQARMGRWNCQRSCQKRSQAATRLLLPRRHERLISHGSQRVVVS